jgi:hypothetical protein
MNALKKIQAAASDQNKDWAQGLRSVCNSVLLKEFRTKVNRKPVVKVVRIVTERPPELSVSLLPLLIEHLL